MTEQIKEAEYRCSQCGKDVPESGWYHHKHDTFNDYGVRHQKAGTRQTPCIECRRLSNRTLQHKTAKNKRAAALKQTPLDLSWNSMLGVKPIPKDKSKT
jgi:DNA-directed RNA polymerase subunit RPC12/RpoP